MRRIQGVQPGLPLISRLKGNWCRGSLSSFLQLLLRYIQEVGHGRSAFYSHFFTMSEPSRLATVRITGYTATRRSDSEAKHSVFSLKDHSGFRSSHWRYAPQDDSSKASYVPLCPADATNEQPLDREPILPTAASTYLFSRKLRENIARNRSTLSKDPNDWLLKSLDLLNNEPGQSLEPHESAGEASAQLVFEVPSADRSIVATNALHAFYAWVDGRELHRTCEGASRRGSRQEPSCQLLGF